MKGAIWLGAMVFVLSGRGVGAAASVSGTVLEPDGKPAVGAPVWLMGSKGVAAATRTDAAGRFRFADAGEAIQVVARPADSAYVAGRLSAGAGLNLTLRAERAFAASGVVLDPRGHPLAGAIVTARNVGLHGAAGVAVLSGAGSLWYAEALPGLRTVTDSKGRFTFVGLPEGAAAQVKVRATHILEAGGVEVTAGAPVETYVATQYCARLSGVVLRGSQAVSGARIAISGSWLDDAVTAVCDGSGRFSLDIVPGNHSLAAESAGGRLESRPWTFKALPGGDLRVSVRLAAAAKVVVRLPKGEQLSEYARADLVEGSGDSRFGGWEPVRRAADGTAYAWLPPGDWRFRWATELRDTKITVPDPAPAKPIVVAMERRSGGPTMTVRVVDGRGKPVRGANVIDMVAVMGVTDGAGRLVCPRWYGIGSLLAVAPDLKSFGRVQVGPDTRSAEIRLMPGVEVRASAKDANGRPVGGARCIVSLPTAGLFTLSGPTLYAPFRIKAGDASGNATFTLPSGVSAQVLWSKPGWASAGPQQFKAPVSGALALPPCLLARTDAEVSGTAVDASTGAALPGILVTALWRSGDRGGAGAVRFSTATDDRGRFRFAAMPRGRLELHASSATAARPWGPPTTIDSPASGAELKLEQRPEARGTVMLGEPLLPEEDVEWLGESVLADGQDAWVVFVTSNDAASGKLLAAAKRRMEPRFGPDARTVIVFDSKLSPAATRKLAKEWGVLDIAARIRKGRGQALLRRFGVKEIPAEVRIGASGAVQAGGYGCFWGFWWG